MVVEWSWSGGGGGGGGGDNDPMIVRRLKSVRRYRHIMPQDKMIGCFL